MRAPSSEPGNLRFDVLRDPADPTRFLIYEVFVDETAAAAHKTTRPLPGLARPGGADDGRADGAATGGTRCSSTRRPRRSA